MTTTTRTLEPGAVLDYLRRFSAGCYPRPTSMQEIADAAREIVADWPDKCTGHACPDPIECRTLRAENKQEAADVLDMLEQWFGVTPTARRY